MTAQFEPTQADGEQRPANQLGADLDSTLTPPGAAVDAAPAPPGPDAAAVTETRPDPTRGTGSFVFYANPNGRLRGRKVVIVGKGPVGLMIAFWLSFEGAEIIHLDDGRFNTGRTAAGWIAPYHATDPSAGRSFAQAVALWSQLRGPVLSHTSVAWENTMFERTSLAARYPEEFQQLPLYRPVARLGDGIEEAFTAKTMVAPATLWMPEIQRALDQQERVTDERRHIHDKAEMAQLAREYDADFAIACTGIDEMLMYKDRDFEASFGLVVHLAMPTDWPHGVRARDLGLPHRGFGLPGATADPYLITQRGLDRIVVGGTMWPMTPRMVNELITSNYTPEEWIADEVHETALKHFPELAGLDRIGVACSVRPCRTRFKFMFDPACPELLHVNGFGGSGITLAPVIAQRVVELLSERLAESPSGC